MATVLLVRHGRTAANVQGLLAGRTPGVDLDDVGREQAARSAGRLADVQLAAVVSSPLDRCLQTSAAILERQSAPPQLVIDDGIVECDYGDWQGRTLKELSGEALWKVVQSTPSAAEFPGGESMARMQSRAVAAIRARDAEIQKQHGPGAVWVAVSHGDIIKAVLADAYGMHLDLFQRITVGPASISVVHYGAGAPSVQSTNTESGDLSWLRTATPPSEAPVGGGAGTTADPGSSPSPRS